MQILLFILALFLLGSGIYAWVRKQQAKRKQEHDQLVARAFAPDDTVSKSTVATRPGSGELLESPEVSSSSETADASVENAEEAASPQVVEMTPRWHSLLRDLKERMQEAGMREFEASKTFYEHRSVESTRKDYSRLVDAYVCMPADSTIDAVRAVLARLVDTIVQERKSRQKERELLLPLIVASKSLGISIKSLESAIKAVPATDFAIPPAAQATVGAARLLKSALADGFTVSFADFSAKKPPVKPAKGPAAHSLEPRVARLTSALEVCLQVRTDAVKSKAETEAVFEELREIKRRTPISPGKPTEEEVIRYLRQYESRAKSWLSTGRTAREKLSAYKALVEKLNWSISVLEKEYRALKSTESQDVDIDIASRIEAARRYLEAVQGELSDLVKKLESWEESDVEMSKEVISMSAEENEKCEQLWQLARKVGYALAQKRVAESKLAQANNTRLPVASPRQPDIYDDDCGYGVGEDGFSVDLLIASYSRHLEDLAKYDSALGKHRAQIEVLEQACNARHTKLLDSLRLFGKTAQSIKQGFEERTCELLRARVLMAQMMEKVLLG